jgi:anti-sigma regulatory factor (Ser/Thr protein kinase)
MAQERKEPDVEYTFGHESSAARGARRAIEPLVSDPDDPISEDVRLVTSELVTNVVLHTADGGALRAWDPKPAVPLRIEVEDQDIAARDVVVRDAAARAADDGPRVGGRGLRIVDDLADDWGIIATETGKVVWAEFNRPTDGAPGSTPH